MLWASNSDDYIADTSSIMLVYPVLLEAECGRIKQSLEKNYFKVYTDVYDVDEANMNLHKMTKNVHDSSILVLCLANKYQTRNYLNMLLNYANLGKFVQFKNQKIIRDVKKTKFSISKLIFNSIRCDLHLLFLIKENLYKKINILKEKFKKGFQRFKNYFNPTIL